MIPQRQNKENNSVGSSKRNSGAQSPFISHQIPISSLNPETFPEIQALSNLIGVPSFDPSNYFIPPFVRSNSEVTSYYQYHLNQQGYQIPKYTVTLNNPFHSVNMEVGSTDISGNSGANNQNQNMLNDGACYQQNWDQDSDVYSCRLAFKYDEESGHFYYSSEDNKRSEVNREDPRFPELLNTLFPPKQPALTTSSISTEVVQVPCYASPPVVEALQASTDTSTLRLPNITPLSKSTTAAVKSSEHLPNIKPISSSSTAKAQPNYERSPKYLTNSYLLPKSSSKQRKREVMWNSLPPADLQRVYIWDLDETIVLFDSLLDGSYAAQYHLDYEAVLKIGRSMEYLLTDVADGQFFYQQLEQYHRVNINEPLCDDDGRPLLGIMDRKDYANLSKSHPRIMANFKELLKRYNIIQSLYEKYRHSAEDLLTSPASKEKLHTLRSTMEQKTNGWASIAKACLEHIDAKPNCVNVLVSESHLIPTLAKVLLYDFGKYFSIENIYSVTNHSRKMCFEGIANRFSKTKCTFLVIGNDEKEEETAKHMDFPFWRISKREDLVGLLCAFQSEYL